MPFLRELLSFGKMLFAVLTLRVFEVGVSTVANFVLLLESRDDWKTRKSIPNLTIRFFFLWWGARNDLTLYQLGQTPCRNSSLRDWLRRWRLSFLLLYDRR